MISRFGLCLVVTFLVNALSVFAQEFGSHEIASDMVLPQSNVKASSTPNQVRIYLKDGQGKINRLKQPRNQGYPKFPKSDQMLADYEEAQFHHGRDFPTAQPTEFNAGVHGTVIYAKGDRVLVQITTGEVMHYLHASEVNVKFGDEVTPFTKLGKTSDHLHLQATDKDNNLIDVDRSFLAGRSEVFGSTIKAVQPKWVDVGPAYVGDKVPVVEDGIVMVDKSMKVYYDDDQPKGRRRKSAAEMAPSQPEPSPNRFIVESRYFTVQGEWTEWMDIGPTLPVLDVDVSGAPYTQERAQEVMKLAEKDWQKIVEDNEFRKDENRQFRIIEKAQK
jgi:murein DD-endopeptidase MepM/ murein hydrolase activator NlpD